jgi:hypothetical protein
VKTHIVKRFIKLFYFLYFFNPVKWIFQIAGLDTIQCVIDFL